MQQFKEAFTPYTQELDAVEAELIEEDMDAWLGLGENKMINREIHFIRQSVEPVKKMLAALEKYQENSAQLSNVIPDDRVFPAVEFSFNNKLKYMTSACDDVIFEFIHSNPIFGKLNAFDRFRANDTSEEVRHIFHISSFGDEIVTDNGVFCAIDLNIKIKYPIIEKFIEEALGELYHLSGVSSVLWLSDGFPEEEIYHNPEEEVDYNQTYMIDISNPTAKKKSIAEFIDKYHQWLEPIRQKMRSPECLADFEFCPTPDFAHKKISWEIRRLAYLYLYEEKATLERYIKHFKEDFIPYAQELDTVEAGLTEEDMDFWSMEENKMINREISSIRKSVEQTKKMLAALEKYQENAA